MKNNYKRLGDYIREVDVRNKDLEVKELLGVSISIHIRLLNLGNLHTVLLPRVMVIKFPLLYIRAKKTLLSHKLILFLKSKTNRNFYLNI